MSKDNGYGIATVRVDVMTRQMKFSIQQALQDYLMKQEKSLVELITAEVNETNIATLIAKEIQEAVRNEIYVQIREATAELASKIVKEKCKDILKGVK